MTLPTKTERFASVARDLGLTLEVREFTEGTRTAEDAARAIGVDVGQIVKSLVFVVDDRPVVCLISGATQLDTKRLAAAANAGNVRRADADEVRAATGYAVGGVPPFGHAAKLSVYCDRDLTQHDIVWAAAGTPESVFAIDPARLVDASGAIVADLRAE